LPHIPIIGVSDSAFHSTLPAEAYTYALPHDVVEKWNIRKFGYHGSSFASVARKVGDMQGGVPTRMIICHLGSGSSITAVKDGKSIDTTMGFTPLEGLVMGTRVGDVDAGAVIHVGEVLDSSFADLEKLFYTKSGMLGVSGTSGDIRDLLAREFQGDERAKLALNVFVYRIQKYIGSYIAVLGGLDALVFCATIGERSFIMRKRICHTLGVFGVTIDEEKNKEVISRDSFIHKEGSVPVVVMTTDEMGEIAREASKLV
ncbi:MAG: acetate kinase, partial [Candidatus Taylorbacteria bacterium]|nr:acetate kinase [Candidatus Taylorbacteria bacterium]